MLLLLPILDFSVIDFFRRDTNALLGIVGAALGASLAAGYIIYTIYDTYGYSPRMMNRDKRKMLTYLDERIDGWKEPIESSKKEFLDLLLIKFGENSSGIGTFQQLKACGLTLTQELFATGTCQFSWQ
jgi:hypothetical protein